MVRIKHRWLLVQVMYPSAPLSKTNHSSSMTEDVETETSIFGAPRRTLSLHAPTPDTVTTQSLTRLLRSQITLLFGDYGSGMAGSSLAIRYWSNATSTFIVRCDRAVFRLVWAAITFVKSLAFSHGNGKNVSPNELPCAMQVLRVSGTIRKCEEELIRRARALCGRVKGLTAAHDAGVRMAEPIDNIEEDEEVDEIAGNSADTDQDDEMDDL